ncbi:sigma 54-interacting transcriptional regulator [bacterium]|nr:sigma 54-interacting transcriptional regulator [bacterium]
MAKKNQTDKISWNVTETILESISDGVFTVDQDWNIMTFNRAAEDITGVTRAEAIGRHCWEVFRSSKCEKDCALRQTMQDGNDVTSSSAYIINSDQKRIPIGISTSLLKNEKGEVLGGVETFRDLSLVEELRKELDNRFQMGNMVSRSSSMKKIFQILPQVAESDSTILIQGETGTGKELLAHAIHTLSPRKDNPFVAINCGALPDSLLESELFGHKAGAFTNAMKDKPGHFAAAEKGSILLDEIGDTSPAFQVRLLRVLQEKEYLPLGSVKPVRSNVRVIAASNRDLSKMVEAGEFRQDLFYRINVVLLKLPPLRERKEDIPLLIESFITRMNRLRGRTIDGIDREALAALLSHDFPGNIRELENIMERAFILCQDGIILPKHLPGELTVQAYKQSSQNPLGNARASTEAQTIMDAIKRNNYSRLATARDLGIHKSTLFRKIKKLGITLPAIKKQPRTQK